MVLIEEGYDKNAVEWGGKAERQWKLQQKAEKVRRKQKGKRNLELRSEISRSLP